LNEETLIGDICLQANLEHMQPPLVKYYIEEPDLVANLNYYVLYNTHKTCP